MQAILELQTDFKAEVVAISMLDKNHDLGKIIIDRLGSGQRGHTKDMYGIHGDSNLPGPNGQIVIQSFRQGIYDALPENLFHPSTLGGVGKSTGETVAEIKLQRKREQEARKFFKPFEQEASYMEMQSLLLELMYEQKSTFGNLLDLFKQDWPILDQLPTEKALSFIYILPILHQVRGDRIWIERCLSFITGFGTHILENDRCRDIGDTLGGFAMGTALLGIDSTLSGSQYDGIAGWDIHIGPVPLADVGMVLPHTAFARLLSTLSDYFLPSSIFAEYTIYSQKENGAILSNKEDGAFLGYSFFL